MHYEEAWQRGIMSNSIESEEDKSGYRRMGALGFFIGALRQYLNEAEELQINTVFHSLVPPPSQLVSIDHQNG